MNLTHSIKRAACILVVLGLRAAGGLCEAHAGGGGLPRIEATLVAHDVSHCVKHGNVESCYTATETSIRVTGTGFTPGGLAKITVQDAQTLAVYYDQTVQAGVYTLAGIFSVDTGHRYCTLHGRYVRAYDQTLHTYSNTVSIQPCGTL
jgi:hypothetical protein